MSITEQQLFAISATERACSALSLVGTSIIVVTFLSSKSFRKPINRLVFYASWGNIMANIGTLISRSGILNGTTSSLCQIQAFLIQWFMPADALWTFAMACNVYLTFFHKYNSEQLRRLEWKYVVFCYGLPFIPAFSYFFVETERRGKVYGSAILWCWVSLSWDYLRIAVFYGPVWFVIFLTFSIYVRAGRLIFAKRRQLREVGGMESLDSDIPCDAIFSKTTEIHVTSAPAISPNGESANPALRAPYSPYSVTIEGGGVPGRHIHIALRPTNEHPSDPYSPRRPVASESNSATWIYTKYAMLFFIALLVTWVPSTVNRVWALARPNDNSFILNYASSFVLPLQGFWNSLIYVSISWPAFKALYNDARKGHYVRGDLASNAFPDGSFRGPKLKRRASSLGDESTQELATHAYSENTSRA